MASTSTAQSSGAAPLGSAASHDGTDAPNPPAWSDGKRYAWLLGLVVPMLPLLAWGLVEATGMGFFWFLGPLVVFALFPLLDLLVGTDQENPPDSVIAWLEEDRYYRWCTTTAFPN